ncbi:VMAP-C domain-containing protein [Nostoc sp. UHCC 0870]|uniref:VMAP-C domain-containing protein n=1 Tax=Nostoc sp. UHCC 0870 TaxID=2914041 RepID=UPI0030D8E6D9
MTDPELDKSLDEFEPIRKELTAGQSKSSRDNIILDYFEKHKEELSLFLSEIEKNNSTAYQKYVKQLNDENPKDSSLFKLKEENLDSELINDLRNIFSQQDEAFWQCVKQVYQDAVWQKDPDLDESLYNLDQDSLSDLADYFNEEEIIRQFLPRLAGYLENKHINKYTQFNKNLQKIIRKHIRSDQSITMLDFNKSVTNFKAEYKKSLGKYYLIIEIKNSQSYTNSFQISGWLAKENIADSFIPLKHQQPKIQMQDTEEEYYTKEHIQEIVKDFIAEISRKKGQDIKDLIIEFFLPSSLFGWEVDQWKFEPLDKICVGTSHQVRIRSSDRLKPIYKLYQGKWGDKWQCVKKCGVPVNQFLNSDLKDDLNTLTGQLQNENIVGLKLISPLQSSYEEMASALYCSGTPIALWLRSEPPEGNCETQLNRLLRDKLLQLSEKIFQERCQSQLHISLIWDDPNRLIPTNYQLQ